MMVNASLNWASVCGLALVFWMPLMALASIEAFSRSDGKAYQVLLALGRLVFGYLCAGILFFQGWRLDPILQFGQFLLVTGIIAESFFSSMRGDFTLWGDEKRFKREITWARENGKRVPQKRAFLWYCFLLAGTLIPLGWTIIGVLAYINFKKVEKRLLTIQQDYISSS